MHGFTDTWRTWELVLPYLEREHDVLAPTLTGHAGGPALGDELTAETLADALERAMDEAGWETAHVVGNSLGGFLALQLAARGRARTVVALAPAGGWADGDTAYLQTLDSFLPLRELSIAAAPHADTIASTPEGRRRATALVSERSEHLPADLVAHQIRGVANCDATLPMVEFAKRDGYALDAERVTCPLRIVWGAADRILEWPRAAARYRERLFPHADWVVLDGVGHSPQLDVPLETAQLVLGFTGE